MNNILTNEGNKMKLNKSTIDVLKNFASINNGMIIHAGNRIRTIDNMSKQIAYANIEDTFPSTFAVYDLGEFLQALNLIEDAELDFKENYLEIKDDTTSMVFAYANQEFVVEAPEVVKFPDDLSDGVEFDLPVSVLTRGLKASSTLGLPEFEVTSVAGSTDVLFSAIDASGASKHAFKVTVGETDEDRDFRFVFKADRLNIDKQDYKVSIHPAGISRFAGINLDYYIATEA